MLSRVNRKVCVVGLPCWQFVFCYLLAPYTLYIAIATELCTTDYCGKRSVPHRVTKFISSVVTLSSEQVDKQQDSQSLQPHVGALEHCPFCFKHAGAISLPPGNHVLFLAELNATHALDVYQSPVVQSYFQFAHLSRAPPYSLI